MFVMGRLTSGMLRADPDAPESPQGRTNRGIAMSVLTLPPPPDSPNTVTLPGSPPNSAMLS